MNVLNESSFLLICSNVSICLKEAGCLAEATNHGAHSLFADSLRGVVDALLSMETWYEYRLGYVLSKS